MSKQSKRRQRNRMGSEVKAVEGNSSRRLGGLTSKQREFALELRQAGFSQTLIDATLKLQKQYRLEDLQRQEERKLLQQWVDHGSISEVWLGVSAARESRISPHLLQIEQHLKTLARMALSQYPIDANSVAFLGEAEPQVKAIGADLFRWGGLALMLAVCCRIPQEFQVELGMAWQEIGNWRE